MEKRSQSSLFPKLKVILSLTVIAAVLVGAGWFARQHYGQFGLTIVDLTVSGVLTTALVILYFRQTDLLKGQSELLEQELNREARQQHTETLRERVRTWHGDTEREIPETPLEATTTNLPAVLGASFDTAPDPTAISFAGEEEPFRVIPGQLEGDRYLRDLLENHAPDLKSKKEGIEKRYKEYQALLDEFCTEYDDYPVVEKEEYTLVPVDFTSEWLFKQAILLNRRYGHDTEELVERGISKIEAGSTGIHPEKPKIWIHVSTGGGAESAIYAAEVTSGYEKDDHLLRSEAKEDVKEIVEGLLANIEYSDAYSYAVEAADVLDQAEKEIDELEKNLIEYEGRPIYTGDCKYLEEARIQAIEN